MDLAAIERTEDIPTFAGFPAASYRETGKASRKEYEARVEDFVNDSWGVYTIRDVAKATGASEKRVIIILATLMAAGKVRKARFSEAYSLLDDRSDTEHWETVRAQEK